MASSWSVDESTLDRDSKNPRNLLQQNFNKYPSTEDEVVQERCNRDRNAGAEFIFFFLKDSSTILRTRFVSIVVENESDENSYVAYDQGSQNKRSVKREPKSSRFAKKGSAKQQFRKKGVRRAKSLGTSDLECTKTVFVKLNRMLAQGFSNVWGHRPHW